MSAYPVGARWETPDGSAAYWLDSRDNREIWRWEYVGARDWGSTKQAVAKEVRNTMRGIWPYRKQNPPRFKRVR